MINFPDAPTTGQVFQGYTWDGEKWVTTTNVPNTSGVIGIQVFTANGTYTPSANMTSCVIECQGAGGGGGGAVATTATSLNAAGGGGAGGRSRKFATAANIGASQVVTIGAAGSAAAAGNNPGGAGGDTSVGTLCIAKGGGGGGGAASGSNGAGGIGGVVGTGDEVYPGATAAYGPRASNTTTLFYQPSGASSVYGSGGNMLSNQAGSAAAAAATGYGAGGAGGSDLAGAGDKAGGAGRSGLVVITEYGMTALTGPAAGAVRYDLPQGLSTNQMAQARSNIAAPLRGWLAGLTLSAAGSSTTFGIAVGEAADSSNAVLMQLTSAYTKTASAWVVGNGNGALDTGAIGAASWYHVFLIRRPDTGVVDALISLSATAPTLPANYTQFRRIGSMKTVASQWVAFSQNGDEFLWLAGIGDISGVTPTTANRTLYTISVPSSVKVGAMLRITASGPVNQFLFTSPDETDQVAASSPNGGTIRIALASEVPQAQILIRAVNGQIGLRAGAASGIMSGYTYGWIDRRGRDD